MHLRKNNPRYLWPIANRFYHSQMLPLLNYIRNPRDDNLYSLYSLIFEKYLVVSCVSMLEKIMALQVRNTIDRENIDISSLKLRSSYQKIVKKHPGITKGEFVSIYSEFSNPQVINSIATYLLKEDQQFSQLKMDFFDSVKKIDWFDPYKYVKSAKTMFYEWNNFLKIFELRHKIIHEMEFKKLSYYRIGTICDNTMNFLDATVFIFEPRFRESVIDRLSSKKTLRQRNAIIDRALSSKPINKDLLNTLYD